MPASDPIYEGVTVPKEIVRAVRKIVSEERFYEKEPMEQLQLLKSLNTEVSRYYEMSEADIFIDPIGQESYSPYDQTIMLPNTNSLISYLHEMRHHIQHETGKQYTGHNIEQDARAWSLRIFKKACPGSFKRSVQRDQIMHIYYDYETEEVHNIQNEQLID